MVRTLDKELDIPVTCKIRIFPSVEKTVAYARMIEAAGCSVRLKRTLACWMLHVGCSMLVAACWMR